MGRYNKLLVAMDGSEASKNALHQAFKLAFDEKKWITVAAINPPYQGDLDLVGVSNIEEILKGKGEKILEEARQIAAEERASIKTRLEVGEPYEKIIEIAEEEKCELVVMGRRGLTGFERALMGSVTAKVIGTFKGRILIVPSGASVGWKKIIVATDGSQFSEAAVHEAINYAKSYGGSLNIINVVYTNDEVSATAPSLVENMVEKAREHLESLKALANSEDVDAEIFIKEGEPFQGITDLAEELGADTIVIGSRGKTALKRILIGSVTARVIGMSPCPVLVVNK